MGVGLLALWATGRSAVLPPNLQPGSLAQLETARGDTAAAIERYRQFLDLWADPDPELRDQVTSAQRALARLTGTESS